mgnify:CR=1 FL=1|jgi:hypothetical protein|tara:strand:- start:213 stop:503 length:291 start_codon:yes stop_codon:yes gene_type:complete
MPAMIRERRESRSISHHHTLNLCQKLQVGRHFIKGAKKELQPELFKIRQIEMMDRRIADPKIETTQIQVRNLPTSVIIARIQIPQSVTTPRTSSPG